MAAIKKSHPRRRAPRRRMHRKRRSQNVPDWASLSTKRSMVTPGGLQFSVNTLYNLMNTQLADFSRAEQVASQYQFYRIKRVTLTVKPTYDTFTAAGQNSKLNLYYMLDKSGAIPTNVTLEALKQMGARPRQLDEKNILISWAPSVLSSVMYASGVPAVQGNEAAQYKISPWLSTQSGTVIPGAFVASAVDHLGIYWYVDQLAGTGAIQYACEVEVQFEFKKPLAPYVAGAPEAIRAVVATINNSPDGVVGGSDDLRPV